MNITVPLLSLVLFGAPPAAQAPKDLRVELPRDLRILVLGVPDTQNARAAQENLRTALREYEARQSAEEKTSPQAKFRIYFRLGKFDESLATLVSQMRELERIKGLEDYQLLARELELRAEALSGLAADSPLPVVQEDADSPAPSEPQGDFTAQIKTELAAIDETLAKIDELTKPDAERKAQLERDIGGLAQFIMQIKGFIEEAKTGAAGVERQIRIDTDEISQGIQGLIDSIRDMRQERQLSDPPPPPRLPRRYRDRREI